MTAVAYENVRAGKTYIKGDDDNMYSINEANGH